MKKDEATPEITGTNKLTLRFTTREKNLGHFNLFGDDFKRLQTGIGFAVVTEDGKSWDIACANMTFRPVDEVIYLYAKCPVSGEKGELVKSNTMLFDSENDYLILIQETTYDEIKF